MPESWSSVELLECISRERRTVYNLRYALLCHVDGEIRLLRGLILVVHTREVLKVALPRPCVHTLAVRRLAVLERGRNVHEEEVARTAILVNDVASHLAPALVRGHRGGDHRRTRARKLGADPRDALQVRVPVLDGPAELGRELLPHGLAKQERDGAAALLVQHDLQRARNRVLARVVETRQKEHEALLIPRWMGLAEGLDHGTVDTA